MPQASVRCANRVVSIGILGVSIGAVDLNEMLASRLTGARQSGRGCWCCTGSANVMPLWVCSHDVCVLAPLAQVMTTCKPAGADLQWWRLLTKGYF